MSIAIKAINGKCPCRRCQQSEQDKVLASLGLVGETVPVRRPSFVMQIKRLLFRMQNRG